MPLVIHTTLNLIITINIYNIMIKNTFNYESPEVKVTEIMAEGVLCQSGEAGGAGSFELYEEIDW